ncbi:hypothetical protein JCM8097_007540 [Rhodosporidiobolus ruineniae]
MSDTSSLSSLDSEEASTGLPAVKESVENGQILRPRRSLLDLPDELLVHIFDQVYQALRQDCHCGLCAPLSQTIVNKHIFALTRPLWFQSLSIPPNHERSESLLADLVQHSDVHRFVHDMETEHSSYFPTFHSLTLRFLPNLVSLRVSFAGQGLDPGSWFIPSTFTDALGFLRHLRSLRIDEGGRLENEVFDLSRDVPSLRHLDGDCTEHLRPLLAAGPGRLIRLTLRVADVDETAALPIPWSTLRQLELCPRSTQCTSYVLSQSVALAMAQAKLGKQQLPLQRLTVRFDALRPPPSSNTPVFHRSHFLALLEQLRTAAVQHLDLTVTETLEWPAVDLRVPSVRVLSLEGGCKLYKTTNLPNFYNLVSVFPSLDLLILRGVAFSSWKPQSASRLHPLSAVNRALKHPALVALLSVLRTTGVLELRYSAVDEAQEMRWTRRSRADEFASERWRLV